MLSLLLTASCTVSCTMQVSLLPRAGGAAPLALPATPADAFAHAPPNAPAIELADDRPASRGPVEPAPRLMVPAPALNVFGEFNPGAPRPSPAATDARFLQHSFPDEGYDADACVDPAGRWLVFASTRNAERADLYLQKIEPADGSPGAARAPGRPPSVTQLTGDGSDHAQPAFSPDGRRLAFCSNRAGRWDVYLADADASNVSRLTDGAMQCMHPSFAPDGSRLVYGALTSKGEWQVWLADLATRERKLLGPGLMPAWCPRKDVDRIAFQKARERGSRWFSLWTMDLVAGEARRVTELAVSSNAALVCPAWSPDGASLAFSTIFEPAVTRDGKPRGQQDVWVIDADGSHRRRVTDGRATNLAPFWGADRRVYFVSDRAGREAVWSAPAGTTTSAADDPAPDARQDPRSSQPRAGAADGGPAAIGASDTGPVD